MLEELLGELCDGGAVLRRSARSHHDVVHVVDVLGDRQGHDVEAILSTEDVNQLVDVENSGNATYEKCSRVKLTGKSQLYAYV